MNRKTAKNFLASVAKKYAEALKIEDSKGNKKLIRGRSKAIGNAFEDMFAVFVWRRLKQRKGLYIFVDLCLSVPKTSKESRKPLIYPDILLCKKTNKNCMEIVYMCEVKCNIGWKRCLVKEADVYINRIVDFRKRKEASAKIVNRKKSVDLGDVESKEYKFTFNKNIKYDVVLLTSDNANIKNTDEVVKNYDSNSCKTRIFVLTDDVINMKGCERFDFTPRMDEPGGFNAFEKRLKEVQSI